MAAERNAQLETDMTLKSSPQRGHQILGVISVKQAEKLLVDLANVPIPQLTLADDGNRRITPDAGQKLTDAAGRILRNHPEVFADFHTSDSGSPFGWLNSNLVVLNHYLRKAWGNPDERSRDWYLFRMREWYERERLKTVQLSADELRTGIRSLDAAIDTAPNPDAIRREMAVERALDDPPRLTALEAALYHLQNLNRRALRCPNPECSAPYFIQQKKSQKFCSPECADPSRRESRRRWWRENRAKSK